MIEPPVLQEFLAKGRRKDILKVLQVRFGAVPHEVVDRLQTIVDDEKLDELVELAARCPDLETFRAGLPS